MDFIAKIQVLDKKLELLTSADMVHSTRHSLEYNILLISWLLQPQTRVNDLAGLGDHTLIK